MNNIRIAIATYKDYMPPHTAWIDDLALQDCLESYGCDVDLIDWQDSEICPFIFDKIFVSTTWNIPDNFIEFKKWLSYCESDGIKRVLNSSETIEFSLNKDTCYEYFKNYIPESLIPSLFFYRDKYEFSDFISLCNDQAVWSNADLVVKPIISADGKHTYIYDRFNNSVKTEKSNILKSVEELSGFYKTVITNADNYKGIIVQPYLKGIEQGEYSITYIKNELALCIKKPGGFKNSPSKERLAIDIKDIDLELIRLCDKITKALYKKFDEDELARFRLDFIKNNDRFILSEIELAEPNSNISVITQSKNQYNNKALADRLAQSILCSFPLHHKENMRA